MRQRVYLNDLSDKQFHHLEVIRRATTEEIKATGTNNIKSARWICRCKCGREKMVLGSNLTNGSTKSCGKKGCRPPPDLFNERPRYSRGKQMSLRYANDPKMAIEYPWSR